MPPEKCRCAVGSILSEGEESPSPELIHLYQKFGFKLFSFPAPSHVVTATFPYTTPMSIWLAARRVHPALNTYIKVRHKYSMWRVDTWVPWVGTERTAQDVRNKWFGESPHGSSTLVAGNVGRDF